MPEWIAIRTMHMTRGGDIYFTHEWDVVKIIKTKALGKTRRKYEYSIRYLDGKIKPFYPEMYKRWDWKPFSKDLFNTQEEYEMFLMLNPQIGVPRQEVVK